MAIDSIHVGWQWDYGRDRLAFVRARILGVESRSGLDSASGYGSINTPLQTGSVAGVVVTGFTVGGNL
jgi:hypothetical protein